MEPLKVLPYNIEAEQSVIGGLLLDSSSERAEKVFSMLKPESFYSAGNKIIYQEMLALIARKQPIDLMTLDNRLRAVEKLDSVGGFAYLAEIAKNTPSAANIEAYANIVRDEAIKRFTIAKLQDCEALMFAVSQLPVEDRIEAISRLMSEIADYSKTGKQTGLRQVTDVASSWIDDFERRQKMPNLVKGLSSGLDDLDRLLGKKRFVKQSLVAVGARPKCGKTAFYSLMAGNCVVKEKKVALLFSLEMSANQIFERMLGQIGNINTNAFYASDTELEAYNLTSGHLMGRITEAMNEIVRDDLLYIDDTPNVSIAHIRNECRRIKRERGEIGLIGVDYLTLMQAEKAERNDLAYGQVTKELKNLAREMDCVVLLLTQLNRGLESRSDKRPMPSDSRDTGQIEQECDYWIGLYKDSVYNEKADKQLTEIILRLNRHGETGKVYADQRFGSMFNCDQDEAEKRHRSGNPVSNNNSRTKDF